MYTGFYTAVAGGVAQEKRLNILTNNLANVTSIGFKTDAAVFYVAPQPVLVGPVTMAETERPVMGAVDPLAALQSAPHPQVAIHTDFTQGALRETGNPFDLALEGNGFFVIDQAGTPLYTRQGSFTLNAERRVVTQNGLAVQGENGAITVQGRQVTVDRSGRVFADGTLVDRLKLVDIPQSSRLEKVGDTLFRSVGPDTEMPDATEVVVQQGSLELSNSEVVRLLGAVIQTSRAYEAYQRVIQSFDETAGRAVNDIARTR